MKHNWKITIILLVMFLVAQLIGLAVVYSYSPKTKLVFNDTTQTYENLTISRELPYGMQPPELKPEISLTSILISFVIAILLILLLMKVKSTFFLRAWFFAVVVIALAITFNAVFFSLPYASYLAIILALPLAFFKIFKRNLLVHNITELFIYPGIAAVFVPILNLLTIIILLLLISVYDIYAVWHSGFMQKMAKFQINKLRLFAGFFVPYADKKTREKIKFLKQKYKNLKIPEKILKEKKIKVSLAILGGGDVVFPIIMAGVVFKILGLIPASLISLFATLSLFSLFIAAKKGKFYPAMPFLTAGCLLGLLVGYLLSTF